jgi:hypothetical protein
MPACCDAPSHPWDRWQVERLWVPKPSDASSSATTRRRRFAILLRGIPRSAPAQHCGLSATYLPVAMFLARLDNGLALPGMAGRPTAQYACLLMRGLRLDIDHDDRAGPDFPALRLFAEVMLDAVDLVRGVRHANATLPARSADAAAARAWIRDGNVGVLSFNDCCGYLGMDAERVRRAIFRAVPCATRDDGVC